MKCRSPSRCGLLLCVLVQMVIVSSMSLLKNKRVFVTGSSGGIGAAIAKKFASEGADVLLHYHTRREGAISIAKSINDDSGGTCLGMLQCDFRNSEAIKNIFPVVDEIWKDGFDILINNAGIVTKLALHDDDDDLSSWHETMAVNLHAPLQISLLARSRLKDRQGVIVNVSSIHGQRNVEWMTAYATSKAALDSLTRGLALEFATDKIRVNAIAPGVVPVERTQAAFDNPDTVNMWLPHLPLDRLGSVEDVAEATLSLCTNTWMTGSILTLDGGMMARSNMPIRPRPTPSQDAGEDVLGSDIVFERFPPSD